MSQEFQREYLIRLPLPLAQLYQRAYNDKSAQSRHNNTFYLFEALVKLAAAPAVAAYVYELEQGGAHDVDLDRLLVHLALPSLGQWVGMLRGLCRHFGTRPDAGSHPLGHLWANTFIINIISLHFICCAINSSSGLHIQPSATATRLTFVLSNKTHGHVRYMPHTDRVEIELDNTYGNFVMPETKLNHSNIISMHLDQSAQRMLRFIFYVRSEAQWKIKFIPEAEGDSTRLQLDILTAKKIVQQKVFKKISEKPAEKPMLNAEIKKSKLFTVVIDAGHGGKDSGALGRMVRKKNISF